MDSEEQKRVFEVTLQLVRNMLEATLNGAPEEARKLDFQIYMAACVRPAVRAIALIVDEQFELCDCDECSQAAWDFAESIANNTDISVEDASPSRYLQ